MEGPELQKRNHSNGDGVLRKHENAFMRALRKISEAIFAAGLPENTTLSDALEKLEAMSLSQLHKHHEGDTKDRAASRID